MMRYYYASSVKEFMLANDILQVESDWLNQVAILDSSSKNKEK